MSSLKCTADGVKGGFVLRDADLKELAVHIELKYGKESHLEAAL